MKNYIGFSRDHSGSMGGITHAAMDDYNDNIASVKEEAKAHGVDTIVSVVKCGTGRPARNVFEVTNSNVTVLKPLRSYPADGSATPLFDSVMMLIDQLSDVPDADDPTVSFVIMVITDGQDNASNISGATLGKKIKALQATDRWTFAFRVPYGYKNELVRLGIPAGNILEWEQTEQGVKQATVATRSAFKSFYTAKAAGVNSTDKFYADMSNVSLTEVKAALVDISKQVEVYEVDAANDGAQIRDFVEAQGVTFTKGCAFYQLIKTETVQDYKQIAVREIHSGKVYSGFAARDMLGLPHHGECKVAPASFQGRFEIYVQSTSVNRKLTKGMGVMIWAGATV